MDDVYIYIFVRTDLSSPQIVVQSVHAAIEASKHFPQPNSCPNVVILGVKNENELNVCQREIREKGINFTTFREPDINDEMTALATEVVSKEKKKHFRKYKLLSI